MKSSINLYDSLYIELLYASATTCKAPSHLDCLNQYVFYLYYTVDFTDADCITDGDIRLIGGQAVQEGTVEICLNKTWGSICHDRWGYKETEVVCRKLGYSPLGCITIC